MEYLNTVFLLYGSGGWILQWNVLVTWYLLCMYRICNYKVFHVKRFVVTLVVHTEL
jgi:hypothetical protein